MEHEKFMQAALQEARQAALEGEVPVGAVIVRQGEIIGRGRNRREQRRSILGHAELDALEQASLVLGDWRMPDCHLYVTLEPCPMCAGALIAARIASIHYGARDAHMGACGSVLNLFEERFGHHPALYRGPLEQECSVLLTRFFEKMR